MVKDWRDETRRLQQQKLHERRMKGYVGKSISAIIYLFCCCCCCCCVCCWRLFLSSQQSNHELVPR